MSLLPGDDEVPGWRRSEKLLRASNEEELYRIFNGGASLYVQHGFQSFVGQSYKGPKGLELEVYIFDQKTSQNAEDLYENPLVKPSRMKEIADLGEKARIDMTPLFSYGVDFVLKGFFVRVIIQDKTEEALNSATAFARLISKRIEKKTQKIRNQQSAIRNNWADAFCPEAPCPGPQLKHSGNVDPLLDTRPPAEPEAYKNEISPRRGPAVSPPRWVFRED